MENNSRFVYVTFIRTTPDKLWTALTTPEFMRQYWFNMHCECNWKVGSPWRLVFNDGRLADAGEIVSIDPPRRMQIKWRNEWNQDLKAEGFSHCTFELEPLSDVVKLTITHEIEVEKSIFIEKVSGGWPRILSNLKSLLETGEVILKS